MAKREIGYYHRGGHRPGATLCHLGEATAADIDRIVAGMAFALEAEDAVHRDSIGNAIVYCDSWYRGLGGGALRETQECDARRIRDVAKAAIRLAGCKAVRL